MGILTQLQKEVDAEKRAAATPSPAGGGGIIAQMQRELDAERQTAAVTAAQSVAVYRNPLALPRQCRGAGGDRPQLRRAA